MRVRRAGGAYTPQSSKLPLSSTSRFEQPSSLERDSRTGGRRVRSLPAFARRQQDDFASVGRRGFDQSVAPKAGEFLAARLGWHLNDHGDCYAKPDQA